MIPATLPAHAGPLPTGNVETAVFLIVGLLGGAHCLGMCGPLVTMYADRMESESENVLSLYEVRQHALFNAGRTVSYAAIGAVFGALGSVVYGAASTVTAVGDTVRAVSGLVVGVLILVVGARYALGEFGGHGLFGSGGGWFSSVYGRLTAHVDEWTNGSGIVGLGLVHGLLPCPILYPAFLYAFAQGSPAKGAVSLALLGLGTFPTLFLYGTVLQSIGNRHRARLHRALGLAFLVMGWMPIAHGLGLFGVSVPHIEVPVYTPF
ncbi:sulfite exporter TauE/SafE family protein [Halolamina sediminis]|uniref:sulfite exporter TauE/SafE family protein n=1 Tax=Halolamina sediminis TaxID=1480675 RepID=UPI0009AC4A09|nr:sulfite exporter TauE/SafE family protein [Halolamina sediminis]